MENGEDTRTLETRIHKWAGVDEATPSEGLSGRIAYGFGLALMIAVGILLVGLAARAAWWSWSWLA